MISPAISDGRAPPNVFHHHQGSLQVHYRQEFKGCLHILRRLDAVKDQTGADHVKVALRVLEDGAAVGRVEELHVDVQLAGHMDEMGEPHQLVPQIALLGLVGGGEMGPDALQTDKGMLLHLLQGCNRRLVGDPQAGHAGVYLQMGRVLAAGGHVVGRQRPDIFQAVQAQADVLFHKGIQRSGVEPAQVQDHLPQSGLPQLQGFLEGCYPKAVCSRLDQGLRDGNDAVTVAIRLHHRQHLRVAHLLGQAAEVGLQPAQMDVSTRTEDGVHSSSFSRSPYQWQCDSCGRR